MIFLIFGVFQYSAATPHVLPHEIRFKSLILHELTGKIFSVRPREGKSGGSIQAPRSDEMSSENPNGWDPIFDGSIVSGNDFLAENNVTYQDLINKPIQFKILVQGKLHL